MRKRIPVLIGLPLCCVALASLAQAPDHQHATLGQDTLDATHSSLIGDDLHLYGVVTITSPTDDLQAADVHATLVSGGFSKITAQGDPARGTRVVGHFRQPALGRTYTMDADQAVYTPDASRPDGGVIVFTGHPVMTLLAPTTLAGPAVTTAGDHITVTLGQGAAYPQFNGDDLHMTFTPLHQ